MLVTKVVYIAPNPSNIKYYESLGYDIPRKMCSSGKFIIDTNKKICIKVSDLKKSNKSKVIVQCDYCGEKMEKTFDKYARGREIVDADCCKSCRPLKTKDVNLKKYGVGNAMYIKEKRDKCSESQRENIEKVKRDFEESGFIPLFETYVNGSEKLPCICKNHKDIIQYKSHQAILKHSCWYCSYESRSGSNHPQWNGGITPLIHYIHSCKGSRMWKQDSLNYYRNECYFSGLKEDLHIHHANKSFSEILNEAMEHLKLEIKPLIIDYTRKELIEIERRVTQLHYWYGFGIPLHKDIHIDFHRKYGYKKTTSEDYYDFQFKKWYGDSNEVSISLMDFC